MADFLDEYTPGEVWTGASQVKSKTPNGIVVNPELILNGVIVQLETRASFVGVARAGLDQEPWFSQVPGGFERRLLV